MCMQMHTAKTMHMEPFMEPIYLQLYVPWLPQECMPPTLQGCWLFLSPIPKKGVIVHSHTYAAPWCHWSHWTDSCGPLQSWDMYSYVTLAMLLTMMTITSFSTIALGYLVWSCHWTESFIWFPMMQIIINQWQLPETYYNYMCQLSYTSWVIVIFIIMINL